MVTGYETYSPRLYNNEPLWVRYSFHVGQQMELALRHMKLVNALKPCLRSLLILPTHLRLRRPNALSFRVSAG